MMSEQQVMRNLSGTAEVVTLAEDDKDGPRKVKLRFADETPIRMPWGDEEVFGHKRGEFDFSTLERWCSVLARSFSNTIDAAIGVVEKAWVEAHVSYAMVRLDDSEDAKEYARKLEAGILKDVSMGTRIMGFEKTNKKGSEGRQYRITSWQPMEISAVAVGKIAGAEVLQLNSIQPEEERKMSDKEGDVKVTVNANADELRKAADDAAAAEKGRVKAVLALKERFSYVPDAGKVADEVLAAGGGEAEFRAAIDPKIEAALREQATPAGQRKSLEKKTIGMSDKEVRKFSQMRLIRSQLPNATQAERDDAGFEIEVCAEAYKRHRATDGVTAAGAGAVTIPYDIYLGDIAAGRKDVAEYLYKMRGAQMRQYNVDGAEAAALIGTDHLAGSYIDILRATSMLLPRCMPLRGLVGNVEIPRLKTSVNPSWMATTVQGADQAGSTPEWDKVELSPKKLYVVTVIGHTQIAQSNPAVEALLRFDQAWEHGLKLDSGGLVGSGTGNEPTGVFNAADVIDATPTGANGWTPTEATLRPALIDMKTAVAKANGLMPDASFYCTPDFVGTCQKTKTGAEAGDLGFVWNDNAPMRPLITFPAVMSTQMPSDRTKGSGNNLHGVLFGSLGTCIYAEWGAGYDVLTDPYTYRDRGGVKISTLCHADFALRQPKMLAKLDGVKLS